MCLLQVKKTNFISLFLKKMFKPSYMLERTWPTTHGRSSRFSKLPLEIKDWTSGYALGHVSPHMLVEEFETR